MAVADSGDVRLVHALHTVRHVRPVLTVQPPTEDSYPLFAVARTVDKLSPPFDWQRFWIGWCAAYHLGIALTLAFAPYRQIHTEATAPVFEIVGRYEWAFAFLAAGACAAALLRWQGAVMQLLTWFTVLPLGGVWLTAFILAVLDDRGNALFVVIWIALYGPPVVAGVRMGLGKR